MVNHPNRSKAKPNAAFIRQLERAREQISMAIEDAAESFVTARDHAQIARDALNQSMIAGETAEDRYDFDA